MESDKNVAFRMSWEWTQSSNFCLECKASI